MAKKAQTGGSRSRNIVVDALDALGVALGRHKHRWTDEERGLYERAVRAAQVNCGPVKPPKTSGEASRMIRRANAMLRACGVR
ncbi:MAG: hypothetical protein WBA88_16325 [Pseudaminobacter sp.]